MSLLSLLDVISRSVFEETFKVHRTRTNTEPSVSTDDRAHLTDDASFTQALSSHLHAVLRSVKDILRDHCQTAVLKCMKS